LKTIARKGDATLIENHRARCGPYAISRCYCLLRSWPRRVAARAIPTRAKPLRPAVCGSGTAVMGELGVLGMSGSAANDITPGVLPASVNCAEKVSG
jgi:hypothetical protein